jgi:hypothetical protein
MRFRHQFGKFNTSYEKICVSNDAYMALTLPFRRLHASRQIATMAVQSAVRPFLTMELHVARPLTLSITISLLLSLLAACRPSGGPAQSSGPMGGMPPPEVSVITVAPASVPHTVEVPGRLQAVRTAEVRARVEGILERRL